MPITVSAPDLTITTATAPTSAVVDSPINVSWTVQNIGSVSAPGKWYDAVYIGSSPTFNASSDTFITSFSESKQSPLAAGFNLHGHRVDYLAGIGRHGQRIPHLRHQLLRR